MIDEKAMKMGVDMNRRYWSDKEENHVANQPKKSPCCRSCRLVKWYPPLLTVSTVMTGVFCWLYVTKPVTVTRTSVAPTYESLAVHGQPVAEKVALATVEASVPQGLTEVSVLSPEMDFLPGELSDSVVTPLVEDPIPGQGVQVVRVERSERPLFIPFEEGKGQDAEIKDSTLAGDEIEIQKASQEKVTEEENQGDGLEAEASYGESFEGFEQELKSSVALRSQMAISLMGDIVTASKQEEAVIASSIDLEQ